MRQEGLSDRVERGQPGPVHHIHGKPVMLVVLEWFNTRHAVYRVLSKCMLGMRENFHLVGVGVPSAVDEECKKVFDEFMEVDSTLTLLDQIRSIVKIAQACLPSVYFCPAIGMFPLTIFMANLRVAPIQVTTYGHSATTMAECIDYFALEEDFIGDPSCFSETLIPLPNDAVPFVNSSAHEELVPIFNENPTVVRIAVAASLMKFNPEFLKTCQRIMQNSKVPVEFHFLPGMAIGLSYLQLKSLINRYIPNAMVHQQVSYPEYMKLLNKCDLYLNPFPYGGMNGIADMSLQGLVGVCRTGPDIYEHFNDGMFRRLGLPTWLITQSNEDYVEAALRLIEGHEERMALRKDVLARQAVEVLYQGRPEVLGQKLRDLVNALG
jgi:hypothetical protein